MPATAAVQQTCTVAMAKGMDKDFSILIQFMEELAVCPQFRKNERVDSMQYMQFGR
jgi:hypothetical protein